MNPQSVPLTPAETPLPKPANAQADPYSLARAALGMFLVQVLPNNVPSVQVCEFADIVTEMLRERLRVDTELTGPTAQFEYAADQQKKDMLAHCAAECVHPDSRKTRMRTLIWLLLLEEQARALARQKAGSDVTSVCGC